MQSAVIRCHLRTQCFCTEQQVQRTHPVFVNPGPNSLNFNAPRSLFKAQQIFIGIPRVPNKYGNFDMTISNLPQPMK